jgi:hypothetical protein
MQLIAVQTGRDKKMVRSNFSEYNKNRADCQKAIGKYFRLTATRIPVGTKKTCLIDLSM